MPTGSPRFPLSEFLSALVAVRAKNRLCDTIKEGNVSNVAKGQNFCALSFYRPKWERRCTRCFKLGNVPDTPVV